MKKKAILMKNTLGIILAVGGIALLLFLGGEIAYGAFKTNQEDKAAQTVIDLVKTKIDAIGTDESTELEIKGIDTGGEGDWFLVGWNEEGLIKPDKCFFQTCVCVCKLTDIIPTLENLKEGCQNRGFCRETNTKQIQVSTTTPNILTFPYVGLQPALKKIDIKKHKTQDDEIVVSISPQS
ncbi:MAG: hypothetical protein KJ600_02250 [Nanoarchaeota archaeon]|nr:hypothetical protein [Nanoarchaeota archaeon]MBU1103356.1 hypothetical protein [Nanoarchaeota archaeon]